MVHGGFLMQQKLNDPRFNRSRTALIAAVIQLAREQPIESISITQVAEAAGVTRPTFYQHFPDVPGAARIAALYQLSEAYPKLESGLELASAVDMQQSLEERTVSVLRHLQSDQQFYLNVFDSAGNIYLLEALVAIVSERMMRPGFQKRSEPTGEEQDLKLLLAGGLTWLSINWLRMEQGGPSAEMMARRIVNFALQFGDAA